jgi:hypothetical protein
MGRARPASWCVAGATATTTAATTTAATTAAAATQPPPPQHQAPAASAQPDDMADRLANLTKLGELMSAGLLTQAEFDQQKARILGS